MKNYIKYFGLALIMFVTLFSVTAFNVKASTNQNNQNYLTQSKVTLSSFNPLAFLTYVNEELNEQSNTQTNQQPSINDQDKTNLEQEDRIITLFYLDSDGQQIKTKKEVKVEGDKQEFQALAIDGYHLANKSDDLNNNIKKVLYHLNNEYQEESTQVLYQDKQEINVDENLKALAFVYQKNEYKQDQNKVENDVDKNKEDNQESNNDQDTTKSDDQDRITNDRQDQEKNNLEDNDLTLNDVKKSDEFVTTNKQKKAVMQKALPFVMETEFLQEDEQKNPLSFIVDSQVTFVNNEDIDGVFASKKIALYSVVKVRGESQNLENGYTIITVPKNGFLKPDPRAISASNFVKSSTITEDNDNYYIRINYTDIVSGTEIGLPFGLQLKSPTINQEAYKVTSTTYAQDQSQLASQSTNVLGKTILPTYYGSSSTYSFTTDQMNSDNKTTVNTTLSPYSYLNTSSAQPDARKLKATVKLREGLNLNPSYLNGWVFDPQTRIASVVFNVNNHVPSLSLITTNVSVPSSESITYSINYENPKANENPTTSSYTFYYQKYNPVVYNWQVNGPVRVWYPEFSSWVATTPKYNENSIIYNDITPLSLSNGSMQGNGYVVLKEIQDMPINSSGDQSMLFKSLTLYSNYSMSNDIVNQLQNNKLYGIKKGQTNESLIKENVQVSTSLQNIDTNFIGEYSKLRLVFNDPVTIKNDKDLNFMLRIAGTNTPTELAAFNKSTATSKQYYNKSLTIADIYRVKKETGEYYLDAKDAQLSGSDYSRLDKTTISTSTSSLVLDNVNLFNGQYTLASASYYLSNPTPTSTTLKQAKVAFVVNNGLRLAQSQLDKIQGITNTKMIPNYNNTGKTVIIGDLANTSANAGSSRSITAAVPIEAESTLRKGTYDVEAYLIYSNNNGDYNYDNIALGQISTPTVNDPYGLYKNTDNPTKGLRVVNQTQFVPPAQMLYSKLLKTETGNTYISNTGSATDINDKVNYRLNIYNNGLKYENNISFVDVLPYKGDQELTIDGNKKIDRGSLFNMTLASNVRVDQNDLFDIYYSTDNPRGKTIAQNYQANFSSNVVDMSKVTMIKGVLKEGKTFKPQDQVNFYFDMQIPNDLSLDDNISAYNTAEFTLDNGKDFTTTDPAIANVSYKTANATMNKYDAKATNTIVQRAQFKLLKYSDDTEVEKDRVYTTNDKGQINVKDLKPGKYYFKEVAAPNGYKMPTDTAKEKENNAFVIERVQNTDKIVNVSNLANATINVINYVKGTYEPIANSTFELYDVNDKKIDTQKSDAKGELSFKGLEDKRFFIKQVSVDDKYILNNEYKTLLITNASDVPKLIVYNDLVSGNAKVNKVDVKTNNPISGVGFELRDYATDKKVTTTGVDIYTTNNLGQIELNNIPLGKYYLYEKIVPSGYMLPTNRLLEKDNNKIEILKNQNEPVVKNITNKASRTINVINTVKGKEDTPVINATFEIYDSDNNLVDTKVTDDQGKISFDGLDDNLYTIKQTKVDDKYILNESPQTANFIKNNDPKTLKFVNEAYLGAVVLVTSDQKTNVPLPNATYRLFNKNTDQEIKNESVENGLYTSNEFGVIYVSSLLMDDYYFLPVQAPTGYLLNKDEQENLEKVNFSINKDNVQNPQRVEGQPERVDVKLKADRSITIKDLELKTNKEIKDSKFEILNKEGQVLEECDGKKVNGNYEFLQLDDEAYSIKQTYVNDIYKLNPETVEVRFPISSTTKEVVVYNDLSDDGVNFLDVPNEITINLKNEKNKTITALYDTSKVALANQEIFNSNIKNSKVATVTKATTGNEKNRKQNYVITAINEGSSTFDVWINYPKGKILKTVKVNVVNKSNINNQVCGRIDYDKLGRVIKRTTCYHNGYIERITSYTFKGNSKQYSTINVKYHSYHKNKRMIRNIVYTNYQKNNYLYKYQKDYNDNNSNKLNRVLTQTKYSNLNTKQKTTTLYYANQAVKYKDVTNYQTNAKIKDHYTKEYFSNKVLRFERYYNKYQGNQATYRVFKRYNEHKIIMNTEIATFNKAGKFTSKVQYRYNKKGQLKGGKGLKAWRVKYTYKNGKAVHTQLKNYDKKGRLK